MESKGPCVSSSEGEGSIERRTCLHRLPSEVLAFVRSHLDHGDIKNLRLVCSELASRVLPRIDRVFLSANPRDIQVFLEIARHDVLRKSVKEIVWDDARFHSGDPNARELGFPEDCKPYDIDMGCPAWFKHVCEMHLKEIGFRKGDDLDDLPEHAERKKQIENQLPLSKSWIIYQKFLKQQRITIEGGRDIAALSTGLRRFPALKRITVTPAAHGWLYTPQYRTPMIREFPTGFNYFIPRGWAILPFTDSQAGCFKSWSESSEREKENWRGVRVVLDALAKEDHNVSELVLDTNQLQTGLHGSIFDKPCPEYDQLCALLEQPNFRRLDLPLIVLAGDSGWHSFRNGRLRTALAHATDMEHFSISADAANPMLNFDLGPETKPTPLRMIFPINEWPKLQHFGLSNFLVKLHDLLAFLGALPPTLRSVELSFLRIHDGNHKELLAGMAKTLDWRDRPDDERPRISIGTQNGLKYPGRGVWVDKEVEEFLYGEGENPFGTEGPPVNYNFINYGRGIEKDAFEPAHERPWAHFNDLVRLGYCKGSTWPYGN